MTEEQLIFYLYSDWGQNPSWTFWKYKNGRSTKISCDHHHGQLTPKLNSERKVEDSSTKSRLNWCCPDYKYRVTDVTLLHFCQRTKSGRSKYQVHKADTFVFNHSPGAASQIWPPFDKQQFSHESLDNSIKYPFISHVIKERMTNLVVPIKTFNYLSNKMHHISSHDNFKQLKIKKFDSI